MTEMNSELSANQAAIQQEMQQKYMEYQALDDQMAKVKEEIDRIESQVGEVGYLVSSLDDLSKTEKGSEILAPLSNGIFIEAKALETQKVVVNVGNNTMVEKTIDEAKEMLTNQLEEVKKIRVTMIEQYNHAAMKHSALAEELNSLLGR